MSFVVRKFEPKKFGESLQSMRKTVNVTLSELASFTKIRRCYLEAFENEAFEKLPDPIYARNFLSSYVQALGGDASYYLDWFAACSGRCDLSKNQTAPLRRTRIKHHWPLTRLLKVGGISVCSLLVAAYMGWQFQGLLAPPSIDIYEPSDGLVTNEARVLITGKAEGETTLLINGAHVLLDQGGNFSTTMYLERGLNLIEIEGTKRYSKEAVHYRRVILEQEKQLTRRE